MPNLNAREVSKKIREYFDEIKKSRFIFDVTSVEYDNEEDTWTVLCEVANVFDEKPKSYRISIDDGNGEISSLQISG